MQEPLYKPIPVSGPGTPLPASSNATLYWLSGEFKDNSIPVPDEGIVAGRDRTQAQLVFDSNEVSRSHLRITPEPGSGRMLRLTDMQSTNGTFILEKDGKWEKINGSAVIAVGSRFRIAKSVAEFEVR